MNSIKKIIIHSVTHFTIYNFRLALIKALQEQGVEVVALGKADEYTKLLNENGIRTIDSGIAIDGLNPKTELKWIFYLRNILKKENVDLVHHYTPKSVLFGSIASKLAGVKTIATISGLGYAFNLPTYHPIRVISKILYYISNLFVDYYIFQNIDDMRYFLESKITSIKKSKLIVSSGVDIEKYDYKLCEEANEKVIRFTFVGRLLYEKGIKEFLEAALIVLNECQNIEFLIIGDIEYENPKIMSKDALQSYFDKSDKIKFIGKVMDIRPYLCQTSIFVLPSYYREGVPRSILEAMAYKKPIITCNTIGCKTTTKHGYNGYLIEPKNHMQLAEKMFSFIKYPSTIHTMGENSFKRVLSIFDSSKIIDKTLKIYEKI